MGVYGLGGKRLIVQFHVGVEKKLKTHTKEDRKVAPSFWSRHLIGCNNGLARHQLIFVLGLEIQT